MEDSTQVAYACGNSPAMDFSRNGFVEQTEILVQLSKELDEYFSMRRFGREG